MSGSLTFHSGSVGFRNSNSGSATAASAKCSGNTNRGLYLTGGTVRMGVTQLIGGATRVSGTLSCFQIYDGNFTGYTCP
jgi:hypothetical protein